MYICQVCGGEFAESKEHKEYLEVWGLWTWEYVYGCPYCGGQYEEIEDDI